LKNDLTRIAIATHLCSFAVGCHVLAVTAASITL